MQSGRSSLLVVAIAVGGLVTDLSGQRGQRGAPPPTFRANVELVQIDVVALDADGKVVRGLTKDDFTVTDRKTPQPIAVFDEIVHTYDSSPEAALPADLPRDVSSNASPRAGRLVVLAIDDKVPADRFDRVKELARQVVNDLGREASMALLTTNEVRKVEVTENRALLLAEIDRIADRSARAPRVARMKNMENGDCDPLLFERAARMLGTDDTRRKAFVYISPYCSGDMKNYLQSMMAGPTDNGLQSDMMRMIETMRRANVAFYAVDPRGPADFSLSHFDVPDLVSAARQRSGGAAAATCMTRSCDPVLQSQDNMRAVAGMTGGFAITNTNDYKAGIERLVDDFDHYYLLGFYPADRMGKGFRPVEVTVSRPGVTLRYRRGYQLDGPPEAAKNKDPMVQLSAGVMPRNDLPMRLSLVPLPSSAKLARVAVALEVAPKEAASTARIEGLDLTMLAVDLKREKVSREFKRSRELILSPGRGGQAASIDRYQVVTTVDLAPGLYQLRVAASSARLGVAGSVYGTVEVPNYAETAVAIGGLVLGYVGASGPGHVPTAMDAGALPLEPTLDRAFAAAGELRLYCDLWRRDPAIALTTRLELVDEHGNTVTSMDGHEPAGLAKGPLPHIDVTFPLAGLAPGPYRLRITATAGAASVQREIGIGIR